MIPFTTGFLQAYINWEISPSVSSLMQLLSDVLIIISASLLRLFDYDKLKLPLRIRKNSFNIKEQPEMLMVEEEGEGEKEMIELISGNSE